MNHKIVVFSFLAFLMWVFMSNAALGGLKKNAQVSQEQLVKLTKCITEKGWSMYSSVTCPACRAQLELFGPASVHLKIIECNPHAPDTQVELCLKNKIRYTPTWLMEENGTEVKRFRSYKKLQDLASMTECVL
jgi:hypothetical protein